MSQLYFINNSELTDFFKGNLGFPKSHNIVKCFDVLDDTIIIIINSKYKFFINKNSLYYFIELSYIKTYYSCKIKEFINIYKNVPQLKEIIKIIEESKNANFKSK